MQDATNNCEKIKELLSAYRDLELTLDENARVERHLGSCDECTREASAIETVAATLSQVPRVSMKIDMADKLEALIAAQTADTQTAATAVDVKEPNVVSFKKRLVWGSIAAAAAAVLLVAVPFFTSNNQVASNDAKQVAPVKEEAPPQQPLVAQDNDATQATAFSETTASAPSTVASVGKVQGGQKVEKPDKETHAAAPVVRSQSAPKVAQKRKVDATLDTIDETEALVAFSADDNMFEDCGISTDEDGLYAIKL